MPSTPRLGLHRIATGVRWAGWIFGAPSIAIGLGAAVFGGDGAEMVLIAISGAAFIGIGYAVAWIIDGFAAPKREQ